MTALKQSEELWTLVWVLKWLQVHDTASYILNIQVFLLCLEYAIFTQILLEELTKNHFKQD